MPTATGHTSAITARKVLNTPVYDTSGQRIGELKDVVLEKTTNNIMFAVVGFGGFLGMGEKFHPVPWSSLDYDSNLMGYVVNLTKDQIETGPVGSIDELLEQDGYAYRDRAFDHYRAQPYWTARESRQ
jgi:sporulation protein YlmC with PRC-barrel domain